MANPIRLYKAWFKTQKSDNGKEVKITAYYATSPNNLPTAPGGTQNASEASTIQDAIVQPEILACNPESNQNSRHFLDSKFHARFQSTFCIEIQSYTGWYI